MGGKLLKTGLLLFVRCDSAVISTVYVVDEDELMEIASNPVSDYYIQADNFTQLNDSQLLERITDVLVCYTPPLTGSMYRSFLKQIPN